MADEKGTEKPTMEEPEPAKGENLTPEEKAAKMLEQLETMGIKDEKHLAGIVETASKYGQQAQAVGELRELVNELRQENEALKQTKMTAQASEDIYGGEDVDLAKLVYESQVRANRDFYKKEILEPQQRLQTQYFTELNEIQGDEDYKLVEDVFTEHLNSPQVQARIAAGQTSVSKEYDRTVRSMYRNVLKQTTDALKGVVKPGDVKVPHVESQTQQPVLPTTDEEKKELIEKTIKARKTGEIDSEKALDNLIKATLKPEPKDPFFQIG